MSADLYNPGDIRSSRLIFILSVLESQVPEIERKDTTMQSSIFKAYVSVLTFSLSICAHDALGQSDDSFIGRIITDTQSVLPMLPVYALVEISNNGNESQELLFSEPVIVEYSTSANGPWQPYWPHGTPHIGVTPPRRRVIRPGESISWPVVIHVNVHTKKNDIAMPVFTRTSSNVFLRAHIGKHVTRLAQVNVLSPDGKDNMALARIEAYPRISYIFSEHADSGTRMAEITPSLYTQFIAEYGDTLYGAYARMGMAVINLASDDPTKREAAIKELKEIGGKGPLSIRARAWLHAARGVDAQMMRQQEYLRHAKDSAKDDIIRYEIRKLQSVK